MNAEQKCGCVIEDEVHTACRRHGHEVTYLSTRAKLMPSAGRRGSRYLPASHCPKCSCGWIGMWSSRPEADNSASRQAQAHLEEVKA